MSVESKMTPEMAGAILARALELSKASLLLGETERPFDIVPVTLDLTTARLVSKPFEINFPFRSVFVRDATDQTTEISLRPRTRDDYQGDIPFRFNDSLVFPTQINAAFLHWEAQSGKEITLLFFVDAEFRSGSQSLALNGGVTITEGTTVSTSKVTLAAATAGVLLAASSTRKVGIFKNTTGADLWIGGSSVTNSGATEGLKLAPNESFEWKNSAALYGYSVAGADVVVLTES